MKEVLLNFFPNLSEYQIEKYIKLSDSFQKWNDKLNLISRKDIDNLFIHHILHSLSIAKVLSFGPNINIIDIGTGGGFPGIPLAIMFPDAKFDLVDSIGKKISAVAEIADYLDLKNIKAIKSRAELLPANYDFVISRAVTSFPEFYKISKNLFRKNNNINEQGILYLKGGDFENELVDFKNIKVYNIYDFFKLDFFETKKIIYLPKKTN